MIRYIPELGPDEIGNTSPEEQQITIGIMVVMDICFGHKSNVSINEYYLQREKYVNNNSAKIVTNIDNVPIGYAAWEVRPECIDIYDKVNPFIDMLSFVRELAKHFEKNTNVYSICKDSARERQRIW